MKQIVFLPYVSSINDLSDLVFRASWHLSILTEANFNILFDNKNLSIDSVSLPSGFSSEVIERIPDFKSKTHVSIINKNEYLTDIDKYDIIIKWKENDNELNKILSTYKDKVIYRTDPNLVRQEGSFYIQCAFDLFENKDKLISESKKKFNKLYNSLGSFPYSWILATGPSIENYKSHDFSNALTIACNSTILDDDLMAHCSPQILVFADPIFHFGISQYAEKFRLAVKDRLEKTDINIIIPFKYYPLLISIFPNYQHKIIGIPFEKDIDFNINLYETFKVKTTANILTLLLLPLASTFSKSINILGCDGRPFDKDEYFWGHGKNVQINDKMLNIKKVHPGFFNIDYNEYYFEHCHTLECLLSKGEAYGKKYVHHADTFIPALRDRNTIFYSKTMFSSNHCLVIEPDGMGIQGHYVNWHNQLCAELKGKGIIPTILCNRNQDPTLYTARAHPTLSSHSWGISRGDWCFKDDFKDHVSFKVFFNEIESAIKQYCTLNTITELTIFCYYGSIQILSGFIELRKKFLASGINIKISLCLFHESVILDEVTTSPRVPRFSRTVLLEALAQTDSFRVLSVTPQLSDYFYSQLGVLTGSMSNPIPSGTNKKLNFPPRNNKVFKVIFPAALRLEKGSSLVDQLVHEISSNPANFSNYEFFIRSPSNRRKLASDLINWIPDDMDHGQYEDLLKSSDVIVIPYLAPNFSFRTSGIIVDAMYYQKPVITIDGTWLGDVTKTIHAGLAIKYFSVFSLTSAINTIRNNYEIFSKFSKNSYSRYQLSNNWEKLVIQMFD